MKSRISLLACALSNRWLTVVVAAFLLNAVALAAAESPPLAPAEECHPRGGLPNGFAKLKEGREVRIAYLGGSITAQDGWRPKTLAWFKEKFPQSRISQVNAAIGGTGSDLGVFRLHQDVLAHNPDLLFVEFAVNDGGTAPEQIHRCMEGIVRQAWQHDAATDICFIYTLAGDMLATLKNGSFPRAATAMEQVAAHYAIPSIHVGVEVARLERAGKLVFKGEKPRTDAERATLGDRIVFSPDAVHPYPDTGHQLYLEAIVRSMAIIETAGKPGAHPLGSPFRADHWQAAKMIPLRNAKLSGGWQHLDPATNKLARTFGAQLPDLWKAATPGDSLTFQFRGSTLWIYDLVGPDCGQLTITVDDQPARLVRRFDAYCTYHRLSDFAVADRLPDGLHQVKITVHPELPDKAKILSERNESKDAPKQSPSQT